MHAPRRAKTNKCKGEHEMKLLCKRNLKKKQNFFLSGNIKKIIFFKHTCHMYHSILSLNFQHKRPHLIYYTKRECTHNQISKDTDKNKGYALVLKEGTFKCSDVKKTLTKVIILSCILYTLYILQKSYHKITKV